MNSTGTGLGKTSCTNYTKCWPGYINTWVFQWRINFDREKQVFFFFFSYEGVIAKCGWDIIWNLHFNKGSTKDSLFRDVITCQILEFQPSFPLFFFKCIFWEKQAVRQGLQSIAPNVPLSFLKLFLLLRESTQTETNRRSHEWGIVNYVRIIFFFLFDYSIIFSIFVPLFCRFFSIEQNCKTSSHARMNVTMDFHTKTI